MSITVLSMPQLDPTLSITILARIIAFIQPRHANASLVSKKFHAASRLALKTIDARHWPAKALRSFLAYAPELVELNLSFRRDEVFPDTSVFPALKVLNLDGHQQITDLQISRLADSTRSLTDLSLYSCVKLTDKSVAKLLRCNPLIRRLNLAGVVKLTDESIESLLQNSYLEDLDLTRVPLITDSSLVRVAEKLGTRLKRLNLYANTAHITKAFYDRLACLVALEELDLCGHLKITDEEFASAVRAMPKLKRLNLSWCLGIGTKTIESLAMYSTDLEWLSLFGITSIEPSAIYDLIRKAKLKALDIRGIPSIKELTENDCEGLKGIFDGRLLEWRLHT